MSRGHIVFAFAIFEFLATPTAEAHFPWLIIDADDTAALHFGESLSDRAYKLPDSLRGISFEVSTSNGGKELATEAIETQTFVGLQSRETVKASSSLSCQVVYGIYHGALLQYSSQYIGSFADPADVAAPAGSAKSGMCMGLKTVEGGMEATVFDGGQPAADVEVQLQNADGDEIAALKTNEAGKAIFADRSLEPGLYAFIVGKTSRDVTGEYQGQAYNSVMNYLTATFRIDGPAKEATVDEAMERGVVAAGVSVQSKMLPEIPVMVTSFGAAVVDGSLYMYGGHMGDAHLYSNESQAHTLYRLDLDGKSEWEAVVEGPGLQGLAMVAHGGKLYRLGGFRAKNVDGEEHDLWSQAGVACFDPKSGEWTDMPSMPEPRSSFDAAVLDDSIYVVGGWSMQGPDESTWSRNVYQMNLSKEKPKWESISPPPFVRRALSVAAFDGKIFVMGGMQREGGPSKRVDVYDPETDCWSRGPDLNGKSMDGFGSSSFAVDGRLYSSTYSGHLQRLSEDQERWEVIHNLEHERFFHRLLPLTGNRLVALGGASMASGKFGLIDVIQLP